MNSSVLGIINLGEREDHIKELTEVRPIAAIPFGGRYRIIDFILSNLVHSGVDSIAIGLKDKFHSLNDHLGPGKHWDLDRKTGGLRMLYPDLSNRGIPIYPGDLNLFRDNLSFFKRSPKQTFLIVRSNYLGNISFTEAIETHEESENDITVLTRKVRAGRRRTELLGLDLVTEEKGRVSIGKNLGNQDEIDLSVEMYLIKKEVFLEIVTEAIEEGRDFYFKIALLNRLRNYKVGIFSLSEQILAINSIQSYFNASMHLLDPEFADYIFYRHGRIYTKVKDAPSTIYLGDTKVDNSLIANGCIIEGVVENCVIFRGVKIGKGSVVRNSIIFQDSVIGENCHINNCIFDKEVVVHDDKLLMGDGGIPYVMKKGVNIR